MLRTTPCFVVIFLALMLTAQAQERIELACKFAYSIDDEGKQSPTSGEMSVIISFATSNRVSIQTNKAPCFQFPGVANEMQIEGVCVRTIQLSTPTKAKYELTVDRLTGAFQQMVNFNDKPGLIHYGRCARASRVF